MNTAPIALRARGPQDRIVVCWKCGKNWDQAATDRYRIGTDCLPSCADEQECDDRAANAGLLLALADRGDGTTTPPPAPRLAAVPDLAAIDTAAPKRLFTEEQIAAAAVERFNSMPPSSEDRLRRVAQLLSAALMQQDSGSEGCPHPA
jgi:hypothetical protein